MQLLDNYNRSLQYESVLPHLLLVVAQKMVHSQTSYLANHTNTVGRYTHTCINEAHSSKSTRFNPYFGRYNYEQHKPAKEGIKSCRFAKECASFIHVWVYLLQYHWIITTSW